MPLFCDNLADKATQLARFVAHDIDKVPTTVLVVVRVGRTQHVEKFTPKRPRIPLVDGVGIGALQTDSFVVHTSPTELFEELVQFHKSAG